MLFVFALVAVNDALCLCYVDVVLILYLTNAFHVIHTNLVTNGNMLNDYLLVSNVVTMF